MYQTMCCPNSNHIVNPHHYEHLKPRTKKQLRTKTLMEMSHWENRIMEEQYISLHSFNITAPSVYTVIYHVSKKPGKQTLFNLMYDQYHI